MLKPFLTGNAFEISYQKKFPFVKISRQNLFDIFFIALLVGIIAFFGETLLDYIAMHTLFDRGFLIGPFCPIYFFVVFFSLCFIKTPKASIKNFFLFVLIIGGGISLVEFVVGNIYELLFKTVLWTYDDFMPLSYKYVSLTVGLTWGVLGSLIGMFILPLVKLAIDKYIKVKYQLPIVITSMSLFVLDLIVTLILIAKNNWVYKELYQFEATTTLTIFLLGVILYIVLAIYLAKFFYKRIIKFKKAFLIIYGISVLIPSIIAFDYFARFKNGFLIFLSGMGFVIIAFYLYFLMFLVIINAIKWLSYLICKKDFLKKDIIKEISIYASIVPSLIMIFVGLYAGFHPKVTTLDIGNGNNTLNIVAVSDIHYGTKGVSLDLDKLANNINQLNPDIVFLLGDTIDNKVTNIDLDYFNSAMSKIKSKYGLYAASGNHEYQDNEYYDIIDFFSKTCVKLLVDDYLIIDEKVLVISRLDYIYIDRDEIEDIYPKEDAKQYSIIVLDHQPQEYRDAIDYNATLQLSGHTHNGQLFPANFLVKLYSMMKYHANVVNGLYQEGDFSLYVTRGYGMWDFPLRTSGCAEILQINYHY